MKRKKIWFKNSKNQKLCGILSVPDDKGPFPAVILVHGLWSNKNRPSYVNLSKLLCSNGIVAFNIDMFGHGESEGKTEEITISTGKESLIAAIDFIESQDFIDNSKIGIFGASYGGAVAIASFDEKTKAVVLKCPASNYLETRKIQLGKKGVTEWRKRGWTDIDGHIINYSFYEDLVKNHKNQYAEAEKINVPTLVIHGSVDKTVPLAHSKELHKHIKGKKELKIIKGAGHNFNNPKDFSQVLQLALNWFKKYLI